ncbi:MAG: MBOAT family protein [Clostridiales bacterium]|nr:MBOAT family protein [Clostridiales bacterium]
MIAYNTFSFFLLYFGGTFLLYSLSPKKIKWFVLLLGSFVFYFFTAKGHVISLLICILISWGAGLLIQLLGDTMQRKVKQVPKEEKGKRKKIRDRYGIYKRCVFTVAVVSIVSILLVCKYDDFFVQTVNAIFSTHIKPLSVVHAVGLSFFVLEGISYLADIYFGRIEAKKNPLRIALYLSFMLTVVEGPVAKYAQLGTQLNAGKANTYEDVSKGFLRVIWGIFKKVVIADRAVMLVNTVFDNHTEYGGFTVAAGIAFYTLQLYCEFSGVMDIVCGLGEMMGLQLPENFARPFFAKSIRDFWQRWHITLGVWLRDYVFFGVSFSKGFRKISAKTKNRFRPYYATLIPTLIALFFVWFTNGFWHGAGWKYIVYGLYYYVLMALGMLLEPLFQKLSEKLKIDRQTSKPFALFRQLRTFFIVLIGMLIFRAQDLKTAAQMFRSMITKIDFSVFAAGHEARFGMSLYDHGAIAVGFAVLLLVSILREKGVDVRGKIFALPYYIKVPVYIAALFIVIIFGAYGEGYGAVDMIYANF